MFCTQTICVFNFNTKPSKRRLLGKPRRCSPAFFAEERESLEARRQKVRTLQRGGSIPSDQLHDLPNSVPALLPVGTRVTCRVPRNVASMSNSDNVLCQGVVEVVVKVFSISEKNNFFLKLFFENFFLGTQRIQCTI